MNVTGGDRDPKTNKQFGGALHSYHLTGDAADLKVEGLTVDQAAKLAASATQPNGEPLFPGVGLETSKINPALSHVHVDLRGGPPLRFLRNIDTGAVRVVPGF